LCLNNSSESDDEQKNLGAWDHESL
jgi:hypothetical protein